MINSPKSFCESNERIVKPGNHVNQMFNNKIYLDIGLGSWHKSTRK